MVTCAMAVMIVGSMIVTMTMIMIMMMVVTTSISLLSH
jgi:hypothetical protein